MGNAGNLIPFSERTPEERRKYGRMGGIKSGIARRAKRDAIKQRVIEKKAESEVLQAEIEAFRLFCNSKKE